MGAAEPEPTCRVTISMLGGKCWGEEAHPGWAVRDLRDQVAASLGFAKAQVKLLFGAAELQSRAPLERSGVGEGALLTAVVVPPIYPGSGVYEAIVSSAVGAPALGEESEERMQIVQDVMGKKARLNDAFQELLRRRARPGDRAGLGRWAMTPRRRTM
uniref:Ubiquitin-like domain-containing protein n=1 Tax=Zooxanthella nutricula TaxID=1333877 RepID=A0A7S2QPM6_9DINO